MSDSLMSIVVSRRGRNKLGRSSGCAWSLGQLRSFTDGVNDGKIVMKFVENDRGD